MQRRTLRRLVPMVLVVALLAACGTDKSSKANQPSATQATPADVTFYSVLPGVSHAGIYAAQTQGYFAEENLNLTLNYAPSFSTSEEADAVTLVANGMADFGSAGIDRILQARASGKPIVGIMSIYQRDPTAVLSLDGSGIEQPSDLVGKKILPLVYESVFRLFARQVGLDMNTVTLVPLENATLVQVVAIFLTHQVDAVVMNGTEGMVQLKKGGFPAHAIYFNDYGVAMYPNVIFTTEDMIQQHPDVVQHFVNAVLRGTTYALDHPADIADYVVTTYASVMDPRQVGSQGELMQAIIPLLRPVGSQPGMMTDATWQYVYDGMVAADLLQPQPLTAAYTLRFVDAFYQE